MKTATWLVRYDIWSWRFFAVLWRLKSWSKYWPEFSEKTCFDSLGCPVCLMVLTSPFFDWAANRQFLETGAAERISTSWVHGWSTRIGLYARIDEWVEALHKSASDWKQREPKEVVNETISIASAALKISVVSRSASSSTWHRIRLHRWDKSISTFLFLYEWNYKDWTD